ILMGASWIAVGMADAGLAADPKIAAERREEERIQQQKEDAERYALAVQQRSWFAKLFHRKPRIDIPEVSGKASRETPKPAAKSSPKSAPKKTSKKTKRKRAKKPSA